jgi:hypothetical protein
MELALNLAWFIIAVGSCILLVRHLGSRGAETVRGPSQWQCVVALGSVCACYGLIQFQTGARAPSL